MKLFLVKSSYGERRGEGGGERKGKPKILLRSCTCTCTFGVWFTFLFYRHISVLLDNTPLVKLMWNHIRDSGGIFLNFHFFTSKDIYYFTSSYTVLKFVGAWSKNLPRKSSAISGYLWKSLVILVNFQKLFWNMTCVVFRQF